MASHRFAPGNRHGARDKPWQRALEKVAAQDPDKLRKLAEKTWEMAIEGDAQARTEIANRLDGKPVQPIELDDNTKKAPAEKSNEQLDAEYAQFSAALGSNGAESGEAQAEHGAGKPH